MSYRRVHLTLKDSNGSDVLNMELSEPEALFEVVDFIRCQIDAGFDGSIYFDPQEANEDE